MSLHTPPVRLNQLVRSVRLPIGNPFLSLKALPFLIVLASIAIEPAGRAQVVTTIPLTTPGNIEGIVANPVSGEVYVADALNNRIAVIDTVTNQILTYLGTISSPIGLGISSDGNTLYVTEVSQGDLASPSVITGPGFLQAISLTTGETIYFVSVGFDPEFPGVASDGSTVYVPCITPLQPTSNVSEPSPGEVVPVGGPLNGASIKIGGFPVQVVFNDSNTLAYVTNETKKISVINTATGKVTKFATPKETIGLAINGATLYATSINEVFVIDTNSNTVIDTIAVPTPGPGNFLCGLPILTPDGAFLYVPVTAKLTRVGIRTLITRQSTNPNNTMVVINTQTNQVVGNPITVGEGPIQVAAAANDIYGYTSNHADGSVTAFNLAHSPPGGP